MSIIKKLFFILNVSKVKNIFFLITLLLMAALFDMIGVASILPFMSVLTNPGVIETNFYLNKIFLWSKVFGIENSQQFLIFVGFMMFLLLVVSLAIKATSSYMQIRFIGLSEYKICKKLVEGYLHQPYSWFLSQNSSDIGKTILSEVSQVIGEGVKPIISVTANSMIVIAILSLIILTDTKLAFIVGFSLGGSYGVIFYFVRSYLNKIGESRLKSNQIRFSSISEAFSAVKEIKVGHLEDIYIKLFSGSALKFALTKASSAITSQLPRFILEAIAFGGILLIILYIMWSTGDFKDALPIVSLYVFAGYRLMPAIQEIYSSLTKLSFSKPSIDKLYKSIIILRPLDKNQDQEIVPFKKTIKLKNLYYRYPNATKIALNNINIEIKSKSMVGIMGPSGSGKTTVIDVILGLLETQKGTLEVDGTIITSQNVKGWQRSIGYVPQNIFLSDSTVASNIAFGLMPEEIDQTLVEYAAKIANLHEFVVNELPEKYLTKIGENGVRLSGGQKQRIGIARALYHKPKLLILDEATNALDNETEKLVMNEINNISKNVTIILIAHRLNTLENCEKIFQIKNGEVERVGSYDKLFK